MIPKRELVTGGSSGVDVLVPSEVTNSLNILDTDLPRRAAWVLACRTSTSSIRSVSFVFMTYIVARDVRLVNPLLANVTREVQHSFVMPELVAVPWRRPVNAPCSSKRSPFCGEGLDIVGCVSRRTDILSVSRRLFHGRTRCPSYVCCRFCLRKWRICASIHVKR